MSQFLSNLRDFIFSTGFMAMSWGNLLMLVISCLLLYLAIVKGFEPLLLVPIGFGMMLANIPLANLMAEPIYKLNEAGIPVLDTVGGFLHYIYQGDFLGIFPPLIFLGIGAMTDFGPLISNPKSLILGAAAQLGVYLTFCGAMLFGFTPQEAAATGIIGGADGPTAIYLAIFLAPHLLGQVAVAAYSYMALVPLIIPPIAKALTTEQERKIVMKQTAPVSKRVRIIFPIISTIIISMLVPPAAPLIGMLMLGNLFRECGVTERLSDTAQNALINIVTIMLGVSVGATASAEAFLNLKTITILCLGIVAFGGGVAGGVLLAKFMNLFLKNKINPLIGAAGVSAVPMSARVVQKIGQEANPQNFLLMHAMGPNVAGVIGTAVAAGIMLQLFG